MIPRKVLNGKRFTEGKYNPLTGFWEKGTEELFEISASVQPTSGKDLQAVPENRRLSAEYKIYTDSILVIADEEENKNSDIIIIDNKEFEVIQKFIWGNEIVPHYKYILANKDFENANSAI